MNHLIIIKWFVYCKGQSIKIRIVTHVEELNKLLVKYCKGQSIKIRIVTSLSGIQDNTGGKLQRSIY